MGGESERSKSAGQLQTLLQGYYKDIGKQDFQGKNTWEGYKTPYDYKSMSAETNKAYDIGENKINRGADSAIKMGQQDTAARMASQGITGGSVLNSQTNSVANDVNKSRFNSLQDIISSRAGTNVNLMNIENQNKFGVNSAYQNQINQQKQQLMAKYGLLGNASGQMMGNIGNLDDTTFWDDIFSGLNAAGGFVPLLNPAKTVTNIFGGGGMAGGTK